MDILVKLHLLGFLFNHYCSLFLDLIALLTMFVIMLLIGIFAILLLLLIIVTKNILFIEILNQKTFYWDPRYLILFNVEYNHDYILSFLYASYNYNFNYYYAYLG